MKYDPKDANTEEYPDFIRASGDTECPVCKKPYRKHPYDKKVLDWNGYPWLNVLCDDTRVKL